LKPINSIPYQKLSNY